jgi:hypothetical protein
MITAHEHSSGNTAAKADNARIDSAQAQDGVRARWTVLLAGLNAWIVIGLWPQLFVDDAVFWSRLLLLVSLGALGAGLLTFGRNGLLSETLLLAAYPFLLITPLLVQPEQQNPFATQPFALVLAAISIIAYGSSAAWLSQKSAAISPTESKPLQPIQWSTDQVATRRTLWLRRLVLFITLSGGFAIVVLAPSIGGLNTLTRDWGRAHLQGGVLTAVVATIVAISAVVAFVGPTLRSREAIPIASADRRRRILTMLFLAITGLIAFLITQRP